MANGQTTRQPGKQTPAPGSQTGHIRWLAGIGAVVVATAMFFILRPGTAPTPVPEPPVSPPPSAATAPAKKADNAGQERLAGRWLRPDGGYILEIRSVASDGKLDAGYFNPNPIHVARAEWQLKNGKLTVFVELRDVNYPGSTYSLEFLKAEDRMVGTYYQAVQQTTFDVEFVREN